MNHLLTKHLPILVLFVAFQTATLSEAAARAAAFSFDSVWFYRDGVRVVPEISRRWVTVVFDKRYLPAENEFAPAAETGEGFIRKKARAIVKANAPLADYLYDPNIAEDACFFALREGLGPDDVSRLIGQLGRDGTVKYVHPALVLKNQTFAYFNAFELEWKTGIPKAQRDALLKASHASADDADESGNRYLVDVAAMPFFRAVDLLAEDIRVLRATPYLVEIKPSIRARLSLVMNGGNIGDGIPFTLTIDFSDRVSIDPSSIATLNLRPAELQKELFDAAFDPYDYAKAVTTSPVVITGRVRFYAPGEFTIPPVRISYTCPSCGNDAAKTVRSIETKPVLFRVSSIIPKQRSENRLIVPADPVAPDFRLDALRQQSRRYLWLAVIALAGLVPCAVWLSLLNRRAGGERSRVRERRKNGKLADQLRTLLETEPAEPHWSYLGQVGSLLREYLVARYGIDARYRGGSGKQFMETVAEHLTGECSESLQWILAAIDDCVAQESVRYPDMERLKRDILQLMDLAARTSAARG